VKAINGKHSSLFYPESSDEEKGFESLTPARLWSSVPSKKCRREKEIQF